MTAGPLIVRNAEIEGIRGLDVRIEGGRIAAIGRNLRTPGEALDAGGGACIPGLVDHHIHLLATAASMASVRVDPDATPTSAAFVSALRAATGAWVRAIGYHDSVAGALDRDALDAIVCKKPVRVQQATGSLWILNSSALDLALKGEDAPSCVERDEKGRLTGRIWRGDSWLRTRIAGEALDFAALGAVLAKRGVTAVTDASVNTQTAQAALLGEAARSGELPQRLTLMSGGDIPPSADYAIGPVKIMLDEPDLPQFAEMLDLISQARAWGRCVAMHCATDGELALAIASFEAAGVQDGDRIEHGSVIPDTAIGALARLNLIVVTQPGFIAERGDRYAAEIPETEHGALYRCASLRAAGVRLAFSTDAPYGAPDPWRAIAAAASRSSSGGRVLGPKERISPSDALALFQAPHAGGTPVRVAIGALADLCILANPLAETLRSPAHAAIRATICRGRLIHEAAAADLGL